MRQLILSIFMIGSVILFNGCAGTPSQPIVQTSAGIVITDALGREISLAQPASQVVGTDFSSLNTAIVLGGGSGLLAGCGNKEMAHHLYNLVMDYDAVIQIGDGASVQYEMLKALGNDNIAIIPEIYHDQIPAFEAVGVPAIVALSKTESFEGVKNSLRIVGKALGEEFRADLIMQFFDLQISRANTIGQKVTKKPNLLFLGNSTPFSVAPNDSIHSLIMKTVGANNVAEEIKADQAKNVTLEQFIQWDPEMIWIPSHAHYSVEDVLNDPAWRSIQAVKNKKVYQFPSQLEPWDYPTPALCLGVNWAIYTLYPEALPFIDMMRHIHEFYTMVYGQTFTAEQLGIQ